MVTELYFSEFDGTAKIYHLQHPAQKCLTVYAATYPDLCQLTKDDENGSLRFEIGKHWGQHQIDCALYSSARRCRIN